MDIIGKLITKEKHKASCYFDLRHTWRDFENAVGTGKFVLFGVGEGARFYFYKYRDFSKVEMVVDNNEGIQNYPLQTFMPDFSSEDELLVKKPSVLENNRNSEVVVLVTSLKFYDEIAAELERYGIKSYFSVLCMEAKERELNNGKPLIDFEALWLEEMRNTTIDYKKICIFPSVYGAGHTKEIVRHLLKTRRDLNITWMVYDLHMKVDDGINVKLVNNEYIYEQEYRTASIWIGDIGGGFPSVLEKKTSQIGIELKHWSSITLKKFFFDENIFRNDKQQRESIKKNIERIDYIFVGSKFDEQTCRSGLGVTDKKIFVYVGSPRSDLLFKNNRKEPFLCHYPSLAKKKLLLYAPTFRRTGEDLSGLSNLNNIDFDLVYNALCKRFPGEWNILLRLHPLVSKESKKITVPDYVIDVTGYSDSEELVAAADAVITDYSSIMFEPAYIKTPVFLLATDLDEYTSKERDFYIEYETLPFPIAKSSEELKNNILAYDENEYRANVELFFDKYGVHEDGHASERAAQFILDLIDRKKQMGS